MNDQKHEPALYSIRAYSGKVPYEYGPSVPEGDETWNGWAVEEHTLFGGTPVTDVIAYCSSHENALRIRDALRIANAQATQNTTILQIQMDGKDVAKAVIPHLASTASNASGKRNY